MTQRAFTPATAGQKKQVIRLVEEVGEGILEELSLSKADAQRLLGKGGEFKKDLASLLAPVVQRFSMAPNIVVVPDLPAVDLTALAKRELKLTYIDSDYERWDYYTSVDTKPIEGRGRKYEVLVWKPELGPNETISSEAVRAYFKEHGGYFGHTGAFTQWRRTCGLQGYHASILDDNACWRRSGGYLCVPCSDFGDEYRLLLRWLGDGWGGRWSFVGFREVS